MSSDPPPQVVKAAREVTSKMAPFRMDGPVEWVLAPVWRIEAAMDRIGRHGDDSAETYLVRLTGEFTSRVRQWGSAHEIVTVVREIFLLVVASGAEAGRIRGSQVGGWAVGIDMAAIGDVHSFDL